MKILKADAIKAVCAYQHWSYAKAEKYINDCIAEYRHGNITSFMDLNEMIHWYTKHKNDTFNTTI